MKILPYLVFVVTCSLVGFANQERLIPFAAFRVESRAYGGVIIEGSQNEKGDVISLSITAFGATRIAPREIVEQLRGCQANGLRLVSDSGIFGRYLHVQFQSGFTSHTRALRLLTLSAEGEFRIRDMPIEKMANKAPEPTPGLVTSRAEMVSEMISSGKARLAPSPVVAHL